MWGKLFGIGLPDWLLYLNIHHNCCEWIMDVSDMQRYVRKGMSQSPMQDIACNMLCYIFTIAILVTAAQYFLVHLPIFGCKSMSNDDVKSALTKKTEVVKVTYNILNAAITISRVCLIVGYFWFEVNDFGILLRGSMAYDVYYEVSNIRWCLVILADSIFYLGVIVLWIYLIVHGGFFGGAELHPLLKILVDCGQMSDGEAMGIQSADAHYKGDGGAISLPMEVVSKVQATGMAKFTEWNPGNKPPTGYVCLHRGPSIGGIVSTSYTYSPAAAPGGEKAFKEDLAAGKIDDNQKQQEQLQYGGCATAIQSGSEFGQQSHGYAGAAAQQPLGQQAYGQQQGFGYGAVEQPAPVVAEPQKAMLEP